jgi:hypothetical protein
LQVPPEAAEDHGEDRECDGGLAEGDCGHSDGEQDAGDDAEDRCPGEDLADVGAASGGLRGGVVVVDGDRLLMGTVRLRGRVAGHGIQAERTYSGSTGQPNGTSGVGCWFAGMVRSSIHVEWVGIPGRS